MPQVTLSTGVTLDVIDEGTGGDCAVVLVHGYTGGKWYWRQTIDRLALKRRVLALDLKGHGASEKPNPDIEPYDIERYCEEIAQVIHARDVGPYLLVGHSMGGMIALTYGQGSYNGGLRGLAIIASTGRVAMPEGFGDDYRPFVNMMTSGEMPEDTQRAFNALGFATAFAEAHPEVVEENYVRSLDTPGSVQAALLVAMFEGYSTAPLERFADIDRPTLLVCADQDLLTPAEDTEALAKIIPDCRLVRMENAGHSIPLEAPDALCDVLETFLAELT